METVLYLIPGIACLCPFMCWGKKCISVITDQSEPGSDEDLCFFRFLFLLNRGMHIQHGGDWSPW